MREKLWNKWQKEDRQGWFQDFWEGIMGILGRAYKATTYHRNRAWHCYSLYASMILLNNVVEFDNEAQEMFATEPKIVFFK